MFVSLLSFLLTLWFTPEHPCGRTETPGRAPLRDKMTLTQTLKTLQKESLRTRIDFWTRAFMGTPYGIDPSGEGAAPDPDPPFNTAQVDCETYVEQVLALSFSRSIPELHTWLNHMRYREGKPGFDNRYYTMALQWIPGNLKLGYLKSEAAAQGFKLKTMRKYIDPRYRWARVFRRRMKALGPHAPKGTARLDYIPLATLRAKYPRLKTPAMGLVVGSRQIKNPFLITHMGFIMKNKKGHFVWRHASRSPGRYKVEERLLSNYLRELATYFRKKQRRLVMGMVVYSIVSPQRTP